MIKGLIIEPNAKPEIIELDTALDTIQDIIEGPIQEVYPFDDSTVIICNEIGKLVGLKENRYIPTIDDTIYGTFLLLGDNGSEDYVSLDEETINKYIQIFEED